MTISQRKTFKTQTTPKTRALVLEGLNGSMDEQ